MPTFDLGPCPCCGGGGSPCEPCIVPTKPVSYDVEFLNPSFSSSQPGNPPAAAFSAVATVLSDAAYSISEVTNSNYQHSRPGDCSASAACPGTDPCAGLLTTHLTNFSGGAGGFLSYNGVCTSHTNSDGDVINGYRISLSPDFFDGRALIVKQFFTQAQWTAECATQYRHYWLLGAIYPAGATSRQTYDFDTTSCADGQPSQPTLSFTTGPCAAVLSRAIINSHGGSATTGASVSISSMTVRFTPVSAAP